LSDARNIARGSDVLSKKYRRKNPERRCWSAVICVREIAAYTRHLGPPAS